MPRDQESKVPFIRTRRGLLAAGAGSLLVPFPVRGSGANLRILHVMSFDSPWRWADSSPASRKDSPSAFVFGGVNKDAAAHGLEGASNVTGVLEREHFVETARLGIEVDSSLLLSSDVITAFEWNRVG